MGGLSGWGANNVNRILGVLDKQIPVAISMMSWCQHNNMLWQFQLLMMTLAWRGQASIRTRGFSCCGCANCAVCTTMFALSSLMSSFTITLGMFIYMYLLCHCWCHRFNFLVITIIIGDVERAEYRFAQPSLYWVHWVGWGTWLRFAPPSHLSTEFIVFATPPPCYSILLGLSQFTSSLELTLIT